MDKDRVKGTVDDAAGRATRQVGEWTGDSKMQAEGAAQQVKGKAEKAWGNVKDAARDASNNVKDAAHDAKNKDNRDAAHNNDNNNDQNRDQNKDRNQNPGNFAQQQGHGSEQHRNH
jgi:uncharacterized protein YjbJ (UPF0337 family)